MDNLTLVDAYLAGSGQLRTAITCMSWDQAISRPIPGKWSVLEVICHLADPDANIARRIKRVLPEERPEFERVKPDLILAALSYHGRDVDKELTIF
jgi:hypothetical protein